MNSLRENPCEWTMLASKNSDYEVFRKLQFLRTHPATVTSVTQGHDGTGVWERIVRNNRVRDSEFQWLYCNKEENSENSKNIPWNMPVRMQNVWPSCCILFTFRVIDWKELTSVPSRLFAPYMAKKFISENVYGWYMYFLVSLTTSVGLQKTYAVHLWRNCIAVS